MKTPFIVAEVGGNHLGEYSRALDLVRAASEVGADAVKFQVFEPEQMVGPREYILEDGPWKGENLIDLYRLTHTPKEWLRPLFEGARSLGIVPFATPFHPQDVNFLETLDCPIYKISSFEVTYMDLIKKVAETKKPIFISDGMAKSAEIGEVYSTVRRVQGISEGEKTYITLLKCTSAYPASALDARFDRHWGYAGFQWGVSDHTPGIGVAVAAVALGAGVIEKHFTLDRSEGGPDAAFSMEPEEFRQLVTECHRAWEAVNPKEIVDGPTRAEKSSAKLRRGLWWARDLPSGTVIREGDIKIARPATKLAPSSRDELIGLTLSEDVKAGTEAFLCTSTGEE